MKILITGVAGFIGSNLARKLIKNKKLYYTVLITLIPIHLKISKYKTVRFKKKKNFKFYNLDLRNFAKLKNF